MDTIITYDIKRNHTEIKDALKRLGYKDTINGKNQATNQPVVQNLPNTTLLRYGKSPSECNEEVTAVINANNGGLDTIFCAQLAPDFSWSGRNG